MGDLNEQIRTFIAHEIMLVEDPSVVTDDTTLIGGVMDSLGLMQLVAYIQDQFDVTFDEDEILPENFRTVATVELLVERKIAAARRTE